MVNGVIWKVTYFTKREDDMKFTANVEIQLYLFTTSFTFPNRSKLIKNENTDCEKRTE